MVCGGFGFLLRCHVRPMAVLPIVPLVEEERVGGQASAGEGVELKELEELEVCSGASQSVFMYLREAQRIGKVLK